MLLLLLMVVAMTFAGSVQEREENDDGTKIQGEKVILYT